MKSLITLFLLMSSILLYAQDLPRAVKKVNPALFANTIDNERIYRQANIRENLVVFSRNFDDRDIEEKQQSFFYSFLNIEDKNWLLELQFDESDAKVYGVSNIMNQDFGLKIYQKKDEIWKELTIDVLPSDFIVKMTNLLPELQQSAGKFYFYNQEPERSVVVEFENEELVFKQNGKIVLGLVWKKDKFVWKK